MLSDLQFVIANLRGMQTSRHAQAEQELNQSIRTDPETTKRLLVQVLTSKYEEPTKMAAATFLNANLIAHVEESSENYPAVSELLVSLLENKEVSAKCKPSLQRSLTGIVSATCHRTAEWIKFTKHLFERGLANPSAYMMMEAYSSAEMLQSYFFEFFNDIVPMSIVNVAQSSKSPRDIKAWAVAFYQLVERLEDNDDKQRSLVSQQLMIDICSNSLLSQIILQAYQMGTTGSVLITSDYELNAMKQEVASVHLTIFDYLYRRELGEDTPMEHLQLMKTCLPMFTSTVQLIAAAPQQILERDSKAIQFVVDIMKMYRLAAKLPYFSSLFQQEAKQIILVMILPLLRTTQQEVETFDADPQEFCTYADDIVDRQNSQTIKSEAAALLDTFIDIIDGCATFIFHLALQSLMINMELQPKQQPPVVLTYCECFLVLGLMSCSFIERRRDLLEELTQFFRNYSQVVQRLNPIELVWYYIFMGYNFTELYPSPRDGEHLILQASNYNGNPTTVHASIDFLANVAEDYYSEELFKSSCDKAVRYSSPQLWECYMLYATKKCDLLSESGMIYLAGKMIQRIRQDIDNIKHKRSKELSTIIRCMGVLRAIAMNVAYVKEKPTLQAKLWEIVELLSCSRRLELANDVLNIIMMLLSYNSKTVLERELALLDQLAEVQKNLCYRNIFNPTYRILNLYIEKMAPLQTPHTRLLFKMCLETLTPRLHDTREHDVAQGLLLLQMYVKKFEEVLCTQQTKQLIQKVQKLDLKHPISYCRTMVLLVLLYPTELRQGITQTNPFIHNLLQHQEMFGSQYQRKVLVLGLCWAMPFETDMITLAEMINISVRILKLYKDTAQKPKLCLATEKQFEVSSEKVKFSWNKLDLYKEFRNVMQSMRERNQIPFQQILQSLTEEVRGQLREIANVVVVGTTPRQIFHVNLQRVRPEAWQQDYQHAKHEKELLEEEDKEGQQQVQIEEEEETGKGNRMKRRKH